MAIAKPKMESRVVMFRMDYEIIKRVYKYSISVGINDEELSFLMGKRNKYFFELLAPTEKAKLKTEQLDCLPVILGVSIRDLVPNDIRPGENVTIHSSKRVSEKKVTYKHYVVFADGNQSGDIIWVKKIVKGYRKKLNEVLHSEMLILIESGYLDRPRTALELYLELKKDSIEFKPVDLRKSLAFLLSRKQTGPVNLKCEIVNARFVYYKG